MPIIQTLSGSTEFEYSFDGFGGFFIEYSHRPHISKELIQEIQATFENKLVLGGFNVSNPKGFGKWIDENTSFTSRHASHIAAVLVEIGVIKKFIGKKPMKLQF